MNARKAIFLLAAFGLSMPSGSVLDAKEAPATTPVASLILALKAPDGKVQLRAIDELGSRGLKAAEAVGPLVELLRDDSAMIRAHSANALGQIGEPAKPAIADLTKLLKDSDPTVRRQAVKAIMRIHPGPRVFGPLAIELLKDTDPGIRSRVLAAISEAGPEAVPALTEALRDDKTAYWACLALRGIGPGASDAVPALTAKLRDPHRTIRREAILALAAMGDAATSATRPIAAALGDRDTRTAATYALGRIGHLSPKTEAMIRDNAQSDDKMLSTMSLWALAHLHPEDKQLQREATEQLVARINDRDPFVRAAASRALAELAPAPAITGPIWEKALQGADEASLQYALDALIHLGKRGVPHLIDALQYKNLRIYAVSALGQIGPDAAAATPALAELIFDKDDRLSHEAVLALAQIGPGAAGVVPSLMKAIQRGDESDDPSLAYALGSIGPSAAEAEPLLLDLLKNRNPHIAVASAWASIHISPPSSTIAAKTLPVLTFGLTSDRPEIRSGGAAEALGRLGSFAERAVPQLQKAASDEDESVRRSVAAAIQAIHGRPTN